MSKIKIGICVPLTYQNVPVEFFDSMFSLDRPYECLLLRSGGYQGLDVIRNNLVDAAIKYGCTHVLFLDVDHYHDKYTINKLLYHNKPIVSGLSFMRYPPYEPCVFKGSINNYETITEWKDGELIEVDSVGCACMMVDINVFKKIGKPYFSFMKNPDNNKNFDISEDVYFCNKVKQNGYSIYVNTNCKNDHIGIINCNKELWEKWNK